MWNECEREQRESRITHLHYEFGFAHGNGEHRRDDLACLLGLSSDDEVQVGLFHQLHHVVISMDLNHLPRDSITHQTELNTHTHTQTHTSFSTAAHTRGGVFGGKIYLKKPTQ